MGPLDERADVMPIKARCDLYAPIFEGGRYVGERRRMLPMEHEGPADVERTPGGG